MTAVYTIVVFLVGLVPLLVFENGVIVQALILTVAATATMLVAVNVRAGDLARLSFLLNLGAAIAVLPGLWMIFQVVPLPKLAHPIWTSAAAALNKPLWGTVSIDVGATLLAFVRYCGIVAVAIVTTAVALDRFRASRILFVLMGDAAIISGALILFDFGYPVFPVAQPPAVDICVLGLILSCGYTISAYERDDRRRRSGDSQGKAGRTLVLSSMVVVPCLIAVVLNADAVVLFSAFFGVGAILAIWAIRQFELRWWGISGIAAIAMLCAAILVASRPSIQELDATLLLSNRSQASIGATARMLSDVRWAGIGAGCFSALLPVYSDVGEPKASGAPTTAALIAIELGRPALWASLVLAAVAALYFFRAALKRGRDHVFSAAGAGSLIVLVILSFSHSGTSEIATSMFASIIFGLALAQSKSWGS